MGPKRAVHPMVFCIPTGEIESYLLMTLFPTFDMNVKMPVLFFFGGVEDPFKHLF